MSVGLGFLHGQVVKTIIFNRDLAIGNSLIDMVHGKGEQSLVLFEKMRDCGFEPNCVTLTAILAGCNHSVKAEEHLPAKIGVLVEIFLEGGSEFTAIVLDVGSGLDCHPVVLMPTESGGFECGD
ncbi:hypothetical protein QYF36_023051 [Acer negundo]|nr:hypothetical protein QYF36_023051 [Acer negundo]